MERRGFFKHIVGQVAQAMNGGYVVEIERRPIVLYEGEDKALPLWLAPQGTDSFGKVCHLCPQTLNEKQTAALAAKTECSFTRTFASDVGLKALAYILFSPKLASLPQAPTLLLFTPDEAQKVAAKLPEILKKLPRGSDIFVGNLDDWQQPGSPVHGRIQLYLSRLN